MVRSVIVKRQPYYAVPSKLFFQETLHMTSNGKLDKKALLASVKSNRPEGFRPITMFPAAVLPVQKAEEHISITPLGSYPSFMESAESLEKLALPEKKGLHGLRSLRHRIFSLYRRFFSVVFAANLITAILIMRHRAEGRALQNITTAVAANLVVSVLMRQELVINALFRMACSIPTSAPMWLRRNCAKVYHIGGIHSGCAVASTIWFVIFTIEATLEHTDIPFLVISYLIALLLLCMCTTAHPTLRQKYHNQFELVHRFAGWTALILFWDQLIIATDSSRGPQPLGAALISSPSFWLLLTATFSIVLPWLNLRRVPVRADILSPHAVRLYFTYTTPVVGTAIRLSKRPLMEWHAFATIAQPDAKEFSVLVSNAGDWTNSQIKQAPTRIWVRGIPACGVLRIAPLFRKIVLVATGSGIGPCLPVIYAKKVPARIFWSTACPERNFGGEIIKAVKDADPYAVIHDTKTMGRPDMVSVAWRLLIESGAEAVCIISNKKLTQMVVYAMESRGIPAFGAIFDS